MTDTANLDKGGRKRGTGRIPDKKEARGDRGTGSDASSPPRRSPRLMEDLNCNRGASQGNSSPAISISARKNMITPWVREGSDR